MDPPPPYIPPVFRLKPTDTLREVTLERSTYETPLGFNIRGGNEVNQGLFIVKVVPGGLADATEKMKVGDQIMYVNGRFFENVPHNAAVEEFKKSLKITMKLRENTEGYKAIVGTKP
eukprot:Colp12_sorted_trinity150504_noHs@10968